MGKFLIIAGIVLLIAGLAIHFSDKVSFLGRLPGDIRIERENFKFYFPITTSILISIVLTIIFYLVGHFKK